MYAEMIELKPRCRHDYNIWNKIYEPATSHIINPHKFGPCKQNPLYSTMHRYIYFTVATIS